MLITFLGKTMSGKKDLEYLKDKKEQEFKNKWDKVEKKAEEAKREYEEYSKSLDFGLLEIDSNKDEVKEKAQEKVSKINLKRDIKVLELDTVRDVLVKRKEKLNRSE